MYLFCLISETPLVRYSELFRMANALETNAAHCARVWQKQAPAIVVVDDIGRIPGDCQPIVFTDKGGPDGVLAEHYYDPLLGGPACRVYVENAGGMNLGPDSLSSAASHEIVEALVDPRVDQWVDHPTRPGVQMALEVADPVQDAYPLESHNTRWDVSNFVTPRYWDARLVGRPDLVQALKDRGEGLDWLGRIEAPGELLAGGYAVFRKWDNLSKTWNTWAEYGASGGSFTAQQLTAKRHPGSRTRRRGVQL